MSSSATLTKDFNGLPIVFREDGYINMTKAARVFGKRPADLTALPSFIEYLNALSCITGISGKALVETRRGGKKGTSGTWLHPKLAVVASRWLDVQFAVWCDLMIDNILHGNIQTTVVVPTVEAVDVMQLSTI